MELRTQLPRTSRSECAVDKTYEVFAGRLFDSFYLFAFYLIRLVPRHLPQGEGYDKSQFIGTFCAGVDYFTLTRDKKPPSLRAALGLIN